mmetsp:Transcript_21690/g.57339  ORF Transcript_21690/g.57339 Transcript_21690/m.57339 type:complete len:393 (-) Transcript_21690:68-1246(-)
MVKSREAGGGRLRTTNQKVEVPRTVSYDEDGGEVQQLPDSITGQVLKEYRGETHLGTEFDIPKDAYGACMVSFVRDLSLILSPGIPAAYRKLSLMRLVTSVFVMALNLILQVGLLWFIHKFVVQTSVRKAQSRYHDFLSSVFDSSGVFDHIAWLEYGNKQDLCQIAITNKPFFLTVLSVWTLVMIGEFRSSFRLMRNIEAVPNVRNLGDQMVFTDLAGAPGGLGGGCLCVGMTRCTRFMVYLIILVPKYSILVGLLWDGSRWLATAMSLGDMVMNAVALQFVLTIDEILFTTLLPQGQQVQVEDTNFFIEEGAKTWDKVHAASWAQMKLSLFCVVVLLAWTISFTWGVQDVLPWKLDFVREICSDYTKFITTPVCDKISGGRMNEQCYPKGG